LTNDHRSIPVHHEAPRPPSEYDPAIDRTRGLSYLRPALAQVGLDFPFSVVPDPAAALRPSSLSFVSESSLSLITDPLACGLVVIVRCRPGSKSGPEVTPAHGYISMHCTHPLLSSLRFLLPREPSSKPSSTTLTDPHPNLQRLTLHFPQIIHTHTTSFISLLKILVVDSSCLILILFHLPISRFHKLWSQLSPSFERGGP
jgi:hypothetical protein